MTLPSAKEISPYDDLDGRRACDHFLGKTIEEAEALFRQNPEYYQDDLLWMGPAAFRYYVQAAIRFIRSPDAAEESDFINGFESTLRLRLEQEPDELAPLAEKLCDVCIYIIEHYESFDLEPEIYGDLRTNYKALQEAFSHLTLK